MFYDLILWDDPDDEIGNTRHMAAHGVTQGEFADVLVQIEEDEHEESVSSDHRTAIGETTDGRTLRIVFDVEEDGGFVIVTPVTAYEPSEGE